MASSNTSRRGDPLYARSYLITLGVLFIGGAALAIFLAGSSAMAWPWWAMAMTGASLLGGTALMVAGLFGPADQMEKLAEASSRHEASLIIMVLAYPVYLILRQCKGQR